MSVAQRRRISSLLLGRAARNVLARASGKSVALARLWPGRTDRLLIAPNDLRTVDATRAAEIYAGRFVFAGKIVTSHGRSIFDLDPPSEEWEANLLGFGWLRHLRAADSAITRANARALIDDWISKPVRKRGIGWRADVLARRIVSWVTLGTDLSQGQLYGMIKFGSCTELIVPNNVDILVHKGQRVRAGVTIIGRIPS